jgi:hypothetical protein
MAPVSRGAHTPANTKLQVCDELDPVLMQTVCSSNWRTHRLPWRAHTGQHKATCVQRTPVLMQTVCSSCWRTRNLG